MHGARNPALSALRTNRSPSVSDELASLPLWPAGGTCETGPVVCGILHKWLPVRGWRPRLFVLDGGLLRYYKVPSPRQHARLNQQRPASRILCPSCPSRPPSSTDNRFAPSVIKPSLRHHSPPSTRCIRTHSTTPLANVCTILTTLQSIQPARQFIQR
jgi:hypothetical protein